MAEYVQQKIMVSSSLYDREYIDGNGFLFVNPVGTNNKTFSDTNMALARVLGLNEDFLANQLLIWTSTACLVKADFIIGSLNYGTYFCLECAKSYNIIPILIRPYQNFCFKVDCDKPATIQIMLLGVRTHQQL